MIQRRFTFNPPGYKIDKTMNFTDIFVGALYEYYKNEDVRTFGHAAVVPYATKFFEENTAEGLNPAEIVEISLKNGNSPFIPGSSLLSTNLERVFGIKREQLARDFLDIRQRRKGREYLSQLEKGMDFSKFLELSGMDLESLIKLVEQNSFASKLSMENLMGITYQDNGPKEFAINHWEYTRAFAQILTGALNASAQMGHKPLIRVPTFEGRSPNYFNNTRLNYL